MEMTFGLGRNEPATAAHAADRRSSGRYTIERELRYRVLNKKSNQETGAGMTINMSSSGILFTTEHMLLVGKSVEIAVSWPATLNNTCPLKFVARGRIVRCEGGRAAMSLDHYEFRTVGAQGLTMSSRP
jgi:hypothetical protein